MNIEKPINEEKLKELFETVLDDEDLDYLLGLRAQGRQGKVRQSIRDQMPTEDELFDAMTSVGHYEGDLVINKHLTIKLRTPASWHFEHALTQAKAHNTTAILFERTRNIVLLSHTLLEINDETFGPMHVSAPSYNYDAQTRDAMLQRSKVTAKMLEQMSDPILLLIMDWSNMWQAEIGEIMSRVNGDVDGAVGNSTGTPGT